ncbi:MAG: hypothetical protein IK077_01085, partial [Thermoguttaceae bacterium]|nr:hypothetical protein [Thermoguttaceae bacterium]
MKNEIIFFDATETRRERMRSGGVRPKAEPRQIVSDEIVKSAAPESSAAPGGDFDKTTPIPAKIVAQPADVAKSADSSSDLDAYLVNFVVEQT